VSRNRSFNAGRTSNFSTSRVTNSNLKYVPFLPTVRRALGLDNASNRYVSNLHVNHNSNQM
jgi:hypothetical protein